MQSYELRTVTGTLAAAIGETERRLSEAHRSIALAEDEITVARAVSKTRQVDASTAASVATLAGAALKYHRQHARQLADLLAALRKEHRALTGR